MLLLTEEKMDIRDARQLNPLQMAYIGDAVGERCGRQKLASQKLKVHHMHLECVKLVNAKAQATAMRRICDMLTEEEAFIAQRGRNAHARHPAPKNQAVSDYTEATAFEALSGFLYLTDQAERLREIFLCAFSDGELASTENSQAAI